VERVDVIVKGNKSESEWKGSALAFFVANTCHTLMCVCERERIKCALCMSVEVVLYYCEYETGHAD